MEVIETKAEALLAAVSGTNEDDPTGTGGGDKPDSGGSLTGSNNALRRSSSLWGDDE